MTLQYFTGRRIILFITVKAIGRPKDHLGTGLLYCFQKYPEFFQLFFREFPVTIFVNIICHQEQRNPVCVFSNAAGFIAVNLNIKASGRISWADAVRIFIFLPGIRYFIAQVKHCSHKDKHNCHTYRKQELFIHQSLP